MSKTVSWKCGFLSHEELNIRESHKFDRKWFKIIADQIISLTLTDNKKKIIIHV